MAPEAVVTALDAWFDRIAGAVHAFGGEVLKFIGDGVLAIFPIGERSPSAACDAALNAVAAARAGMTHLDQARQRQGLPPLPFGAALHLGEMLWGNIGTAGVQPSSAPAERHLEPLQNFSRFGIDVPQLALVIFPSTVPELAVDPGNSSDEAVGLDGAKYSSCLGVELKDLALAMSPHPERPFGPCEPRATAARRRDRGEHTAGVRIDLLDAILGELKQMLAVEGRSRMRGNIDRAQYLPARGIERVDFVSGRKPDMLTVKRNPTHAVDPRKGSILTNDFCR